MRENRMPCILLPAGYFTFLILVLWMTLVSIQAQEPSTPEGLIPGYLRVNHAGQ